MAKNVLIVVLLALLSFMSLAIIMSDGPEDHDRTHAHTEEQKQEECVNLVDENGESVYTEDECAEMQGDH